MNDDNKSTGVSGRSERCKRRAKKTRDANSREWEMVLARAFQVLAEAEMETAARCQVAAA